MLIGTGGTPEGIIAAAAMRCMGGQLLARLAPTDAAERQKAIDAGHDPDQILTTQDLVAGENVFFRATGVTDGDLLRGVRYTGTGAHTQSIVMRSKSGTVRISGPDARAAVSPYDIFARELTITGSQSLQRTLHRAMRLLSEGLLDGDSYITERVGLNDIARALEVVRRGEGIKTQLVPSDRRA